MIGSTRVALNAGINAAIIAIKKNTADTTTNVTPSVG
jgi:hypothetical protein